MKSYMDIIWYLLLVTILFFAGVTYQWHFSKYPKYPFSIFGSTLDHAKDNITET